MLVINTEKPVNMVNTMINTMVNTIIPATTIDGTIVNVVRVDPVVHEDPLGTTDTMDALDPKDLREIRDLKDPKE